MIDWVEEMRAHQRQLKHLHESLAAQEMEALRLEMISMDLLFPAHSDDVGYGQRMPLHG